jgi:protein AaeX
MPREIAVFSLLIPGLLPILLGCVVIFAVLDRLLTRWGCYRFVWHPALFRASLFTALFCIAGMLLRPWR